MCRCFVCDLDWDDEGSRFQVNPVNAGALPPASYRCEPKRDIAVVVQDNQSHRHLRSAYWSLIPHWSPQLELAYPTYNARIESAAVKPTFADSTTGMRAVIPANGYYEWHGEHPYYFHDPDSPVLAMAGLYSWWRPNASTGFRLTATILTTKARGDAARVHDRMPVLLSPDLYTNWLNPAVDGATLLDQVRSSGARLSSRLEMFQVAPLTGNGPQLIEPNGSSHDGRHSPNLALFD